MEVLIKLNLAHEHNNRELNDEQDEITNHQSMTLLTNFILGWHSFTIKRLSFRIVYAKV